jgi:LAS superfamily LD-carboxypeptidase LdcB
MPSHTELSAEVSADELTGQTDGHLVPVPSQLGLMHAQALPAYCELRLRAQQAGFQLSVVSGFRSFQQQLQIWNNKFTGLRPILDHASRPIDPAILSEEEKVFAILHWSMLPGASRHHWGTELDVCDYSALPQDYQLQLIPEEYDSGGYLADFSSWLDEALGGSGFYRPYRQDQGGVAREPWHLSYKPVADINQSSYDLALLEKTIGAADIQGKAAILDNIEQIYKQYIINICNEN